MKLVHVAPDDLEISADMSRSRGSKVFEEHLRSSIDEMGLSEPLKVAALPSGKYLVVDGVLRLRAVNALRVSDPHRFENIPVYLVDHKQRFEIRYQTDIYQDLLPSQLATLVEHLHDAENVRKVDIARYIGVSPATLRNYTGLWRLIQRGGLFARLVELMDHGVFPSSNPYAWLRLNDEGLHEALRYFSDDSDPADWMNNRLARARRGDVAPYSLKAVEGVTDGLPDHCYREDEEVRNRKRELGQRRAIRHTERQATVWDAKRALSHLKHVSESADEPVLRHAAHALTRYLQ